MTLLSEASGFIIWLIKYLGFHFWRWFLLSLCLYGIWAGLDGLSINFFSSDLKEFSIENVEKNGVGGNRYVKITGEFRGDVYVYKEKLGRVESVLYPVVSNDIINKITERVALQKESKGNLLEDSFLVPDFRIRVVVNWPLAMPSDRFKNWINENLGIEENNLTGIVLTGWDEFNEDDTKLLKSMGLLFHEDLIFIQKDAEPVSIFQNIIYLLCGLVG